MAFGIGTNCGQSSAGILRGKQINIACECWYTSGGRCMPLMIKFEDEEGIIRTVRDFQITYSEKKNYSGIPSVEYGCVLRHQGIQREVRLLFFIDEGRWVMNLLQA